MSKKRGVFHFDAIIGNPPFLGGKSISGSLSISYLEWLHQEYPDSAGQVDLVTFFLRRAFDLVRDRCTLGLITTNTIAQGDSRHAGLMSICKRGGVIYAAIKRIPWPGAAAVVVSEVFVAKAFRPSGIVLNGKGVTAISCYLVPGTFNDEPKRLLANADTAFMGYYNYGEGFVFDDQNLDCEPLERMKEICDTNPRSSERIFPLLAGEEFLDSPTFRVSRYVIDFEDMPETEAKKGWPELFEILERRVKPERQHCKRDRLRKLWWQFGEIRPGLRAATVGKSRILMHAFNSTHLAFGYLPSSVYIASPHYAIVLESYAAFAVLQCRTHEVWARFFASSLKDHLRYTASDCFENFPFPPDWKSASTLEAVGKEYYEFRAAVMVRNDEGLTKTYNRFHDPSETDPSILRLRALHSAMDRVLLDAYGWTDLSSSCKFLLDYQDEEDEETSSRKRKPWRYRWPDEVRDEVIARLLTLNAERAEQERIAGNTMHGSSKKAAGRTSRKKAGGAHSGVLFDS